MPLKVKVSRLFLERRENRPSIEKLGTGVGREKLINERNREKHNKCPVTLFSNIIIEKHKKNLYLTNRNQL